eukprot:CAMPEP_0174886024 /NCGR_PEP_ID=MMETSP0167-20121228/1286_1 /TAXON_ID=38298 /ORGANISM="Rhodella maculata, Strain CCMP736" /LENGTH=197 /DNA_ID=CAMNT_0016121847 /DNA_START=347 /DNA_END=940 /DNA_ORIENTATION=-
MERLPGGILVDLLKLLKACCAKHFVDDLHRVGAELTTLDNHEAVCWDKVHALFDLKRVHSAEEAVPSEVGRGTGLDETFERVTGFAIAEVIRLGLQLGEEAELGGLQVVPVVLLDPVVNRGKTSAGVGVDVAFTALEAIFPLARVDLVDEHGLLEPRPTGMSNKRLGSASAKFLDESDILCLAVIAVILKSRPRIFY